MGEVDYAGFVNGINSTANQGLASVLQSIQYRQQMARQKEQDALAAKLSNLQMEKERLQLAKLQGERDYQTGLQAAIESPNIVTAKQGEVKPQPSLADVLPSTPAYTPMPSSPQGQSATMLADNNPSPEMLGKMMDTARRPSLQDLNPTQETRTDFGQLAPAYNGPLQPGVTLETQQQSPEKAAYAYALKHGKPEEAAKYATLADAVPKTSEIAMKHAKEIAALGDPKGAIAHFNKMTGANLTYQGHKDDFIQIKDETSGRMAAYNWRTGETKEIAHVTPKPDAEALANKRFENQMELQRQQIEASDRRSAAQIAAADRRAQQQIAATDRHIAMKENKGGQGKILPAAQLNDLNDQAALLNTLKEAQTLSGKVNTGPVAGRVQSLGQYVGMASKDFNQMKQKIATVNNTMLKLRSGAAVTESEYQRFLQEMPTVNDDEATRNIKFAGAISYAQNLLDNKKDMLEEGGYRVPSQTISRASGGQSAPRQAAPAAKKRPLPKF